MRLVMMGTGNFARPTFQGLLSSAHSVVGLVTQPERPMGQQRGSTRQLGEGLKPLAIERDIPVLQPENMNTTEAIDQLRALQPDLLVVAAYGQILSKDVLAVPPLGGINVHASLLPKFRGAAPVAWAIYHGETRTGVSIIKMSVTLDAGDILGQEAIDIGPEETAGELELRLAVLGRQLALRVIDQIAAGTAHGTKQDKTQASKAPKLTKENGLIDWSRPARDVCNQIRAMQPWPTAYTFWHRVGKQPQRWIIHRAMEREGRATEALATGQLIVPPQNAPRLCVTAGAASQVEILEFQPAGNRRMTAVEFLRGHRPEPGDRLGPENA